MADLTAALLAGQVVVVPTDTVYGLAVVPTVPGATQRLFDLKGRGRDVPIAVLVASADQAWSVASAVPPAAVELAERWWPGPLTIIVHRASGWNADLGDDTTTVGLRCPDHELVRSLCEAVGPLATTSANVHGQPTPRTLDEVLSALGPGIAMAVDGGELGAVPSTVVDCTVEPRRVVREGAIQL